MSRRDRQNEIFASSLILLALIVAVILLGVIVQNAGAVITDTPIAAKPMSSYAPDARRCDKHLVEYTDADWNEETHEYPINHAWRDCMGVGHK